MALAVALGADSWLGPAPSGTRAEAWEPAQLQVSPFSWGAGCLALPVLGAQVYNLFETLLLIRGGFHAEVELQNPLVDLLNFLRALHMLPQWLHHLPFPPTVHRIQISPHLCQFFFFFFFFFWFSFIFAILMGVKPAPAGASPTPTPR